MERKIKLTISEANCRSGHFTAGETFIVDDLCPPLCHELWNTIYPYVFTLQNGGALDKGESTGFSFDARCPDGGRVKIHGELLAENSEE